MSVSHLKNNQSIGKFLDVAFGRIPFVGDLCFSSADGTYVYAYNALGEGEWTEIEALFWKGKKLAATEYNFHPGAIATAMTTGSQTVDPFFPKDIPHSRTAAVGYRVPLALADADTLNNPPVSMEGIAKTKKSADYNSSGVQTDFSYSLNAARQVVQLLKDYARLPHYPGSYASAAAYALSRIDWGAWIDFRNFHNTTESNDYRAIPDLPGFGLTAKYYSDTNLTTFSEKFVHPNFDINYTTQPPATITSPPLSARFEGYIKFPFSETFTITVTADNGRRLSLDNSLLINQWQNDGFKTPGIDTATFTAKADEFVPILIDWNDAGVVGQLKIEWESASQSKEIIPSKYLYPKEEARPVYESHIFFSQPTTPIAAIDEILRITNSVRQDVNGKIRLLPLDTLSSSFNFDLTNIIEGTFKASPPSALRTNPVTEYRAKMRNALTRFIETPISPPSHFPTRLTGREIENVQEVELYSCSIFQALKVLAMTERLNNEPFTDEWDSLEAKSYPVIENDLVTITHRKTGNTPQVYRILEATDKQYGRVQANNSSGAPPMRRFRAARWKV